MNLNQHEVDEVTGIIKAHKRNGDKQTLLSISDWKQTIATLLTLVTVSVGVTLWASNAHANIQNWTVDQDFVTKTDLKEIIKEQYVPRYEFEIVKEKLDANEKQHIQLQKSLDKLSEKIDKIREGQTRGRLNSL